MKRLILVIIVLIGISSCSKTDSVTPLPVIIEKTRTELAKVEFDNSYTLTPKAPLQAQDIQISNFATGYVGKLQADEIWKYEVLNNPNINKVRLWINDTGHSNIYTMFSGKYQKLLQTGIVQLRSNVAWGLVDETTVNSYDKNIYSVNGLTPNSTNANTSHGEMVMKTVLTEGTGFDMDFLLQVADKYPNFGTSPITIIFEGSMLASATIPIKKTGQVDDRILQEINVSPVKYNIYSVSYSPVQLKSDGTPQPTIKTLISNDKLLNVVSLPNAGPDTDRKENIIAGEYYNANTKNFVMVGGVNSSGNLSTNYSPYKAVTTTTSFYAGDGVNTGTSFATPNTAVQLTKTAMLLPNTIVVATLKTLVINSATTLSTGEPRLDYGSCILEALAKKPNIAEVGPIDNYLLSDQYEVIDPTGKIKIDWKNGKSYLNTQTVSTLTGTTLKFVVRIPHSNGKVYFPTVRYLVKNTGSYNPIPIIK